MRNHVEARNELSIGLFGRATSLSSKSEKGYFYFAKYLDSLMSDAKQRQEATRAGASDKGLDRLGGKSRHACHQDPYDTKALEKLLCTCSEGSISTLLIYIRPLHGWLL